MEFVVQKAVELGVASITPIMTERCVVKLDQERLTKNFINGKQLLLPRVSSQAVIQFLRSIHP